jgi:hypothetical protein
VTVIELSSEWEGCWERFVAEHPAGLLYHSLRYRDLLIALLGCRQRYALACRGDVVEGVMPLLVADGTYGEVLNSMPYFGSPGGALTTTSEAAEALLAWYAEKVNAASVAAATVVTNPFDPGVPLPAHDLRVTRVNHTTMLDGDATLRDLVRPSARRNVTKALRAGVTVAVENGSLDAVRALHQESMRAKGAVLKSDAFFAAVPRHLRPADDYEVYVARLNGTPLAALLVFHFGGTVEYFVPATDSRYRSLQPLAAILWQAMTEAIARGARRWNWGGSPPGHETLMRFKAKWGGEPRAYSYAIKLNSDEVAAAAPEKLLAAYPGFYVRPFDDAVVPTATAVK